MEEIKTLKPGLNEILFTHIYREKNVEEESLSKNELELRRGERHNLQEKFGILTE